MVLKLHLPLPPLCAINDPTKIFDGVGRQAYCHWSYECHSRPTEQALAKLPL
jgi:hypothetical protein